jgi:hypothetical protein
MTCSRVLRASCGVLLLSAACAESGGGAVTEPAPTCIVHSVSFAIRDTAVYVDGSFPHGALLSGSAACSDSILRFEVQSDVLTVDAAAGLVRGRTFGRTRLTVRAGHHVDSMFVSVVPRGRLASRALTSTGGVTLLNTDLSGRRTFALPQLGGSVLPVAWLPPGDAMLVEHTQIPNIRIARLDTLGGSVFVTPFREQNQDTDPSLSPDGAWVYFTSKSNNENTPGVSRVPFGGGAVEHVWGGSDARLFASRPVVSPDGSRLAFYAAFDAQQEPIIRFLDRASGTLLPDALHGEAVRYAPSGTQVLVTRDGGIWVADAPGAPFRRLSSPFIGMRGGGTWSPDAAWVVTARLGPEQIVLFQASTGLMVPLPNTAGLDSPVWHPSIGM